MKKTTGAKVAIIFFTIVVGATTSLIAQDARFPTESWVDRVMSVRSLVAGVPQWSPDGSRILFAGGLGGSELWTIDANGGFPRRLAPHAGAAGRTAPPTWSPDGRWIAHASDKGGSVELWLWSVEDGREIQLTDLGGRINSWSWSPDGRWIAFANGRYGGFDIWKVAVPSGDATRLTSESRYEVFPSWTPDSRKILYVRLDGRWMDHDVFEIDPDGSNPRLVLSDTDFFDYRQGTAFGYPMVSPDGETLLFRSQRSDWLNYWTIPLTGGEPRRVAPAEAEQAEGQWSPDGRWIAYVETHNGTDELRAVPAAGGQPRVLVSPDMGVVANIDWAPDSRRLSYTLATPTSAADLYVVSLDGSAPTQLTFSAPGGNLEADLVTPDKISYETFDGRSINAYLYKPHDMRPGERFPAIVLIHGGPTSHFADSYQLHAQFFTQQGYVMLLPNVRGSSGYGREFELLNNGDWGHGDRRDIVAGAEYLRSLPYVNPDRLGVEGTSYGGFLTPAVIAWSPDVFQAAIPISGYPNRVRFMEDGEYQHIQQLAYEFGPFDENEEVYYRNSPFFAVKNIQTPTFVIHGEGRFPESPQMKYFADELERHYKVFRYKSYKGETFYVNSRENTRQMLLDMLDFFNQYLKE